MVKEIYQQKEIVARHLGALYRHGDGACRSRRHPAGGIQRKNNQPDFDLGLWDVALRRPGQPHSGSSVLRGLPVEIDIPASFATASPRSMPGTLAIVVSQSGETADTLAALRYAKQHKQHVLAVVNVVGSSIARDSDVGDAGSRARRSAWPRPKRSLASFTVLACLAITAGPRARHPSRTATSRASCSALIQVPRPHGRLALTLEPQLERLLCDLAKSRDALYLGRGTSFPWPSKAR